MNNRLRLLAALCLTALLCACAQAEPVAGGESSSAADTSSHSAATPAEEPDSEDAYTVYRRVAERMQKADSLSAHVLYEVEIAVDDSAASARMEGEMQQVGSGPDLGVRVNMQTDLPDASLESETFYRDGVLYQSAADRRIRMPAEPEQVLSQMRAVHFAFEQTAVESSAISELAGGSGRDLGFTLSGERMHDNIWAVAQSILVSMGLPQAEEAESDPTFSDVAYRVVADESDAIKSSELLFSVYLTQQGQAVSLGMRVALSDIALDTLAAIDYPDDLESYGDMLALLEEELDKLNEELAELEDPTYRPVASAYTVVNEFGDECLAARLIQGESDSLDYFFWLLNQTQVGLTGTVPPTGFAAASEITTEGLLRLFCLANPQRMGEFADEQLETFRIPDDIPPQFLSGVLTGYAYRPETLPAEYGHASGAVSFPIALCHPAPNPCRVDRVEVLSEERLRIAATGLALDRETPINTQEIVLTVGEQGQVVFESYRIRAL